MPLRKMTNRNPPLRLPLARGETKTIDETIAATVNGMTETEIVMTVAIVATAIDATTIAIETAATIDGGETLAEIAIEAAATTTTLDGVEIEIEIGIEIEIITATEIAGMIVTATMTVAIGTVLRIVLSGGAVRSEKKSTTARSDAKGRLHAGISHTQPYFSTHYLEAAAAAAAAAASASTS
eukprot:m.26621 g.26621  ORF g.26621 m.26621 type:complete len:182 (-) comp6332_c0_seq2:1256-1801(-)